MIGVGDPVVEQLIDPAGPQVGAAVGERRGQLLGAGGDTHQVDGGTPQKRRGPDRGGHLPRRSLRRGIEQAVDGVGPVADGRWKFDPTGLEGRVVRRFFEGEAIVPGQATVDPGPQGFDLGRREPGALRRHLQVGVGGGDPTEQQALGTLPLDHSRARLPAT